MIRIRISDQYHNVYYLHYRKGSWLLQCKDGLSHSMNRIADDCMRLQFALDDAVASDDAHRAAMHAIHTFARPWVSDSATIM